MADGADIPISTIPKNSKEEIRITLSQWRGYDLVHLRVFTDAADRAERLATKSGFGLQVSKLPEMIEALQATLVEARMRGWLK